MSRTELAERPVSPGWIQALLDATPDAIVGVDASGHILFANRACESLFGYRRTELVGALARILYPPEEHDRWIRLRQRLWAEPRLREVTRTILAKQQRKDGTVFPAETTLSFLAQPERPLIIAAFRDITARLAAEAEHTRLAEQVERHKAQQTLQRAQQLEALGQLAGGVAHDFNNLLAVILNYAGLLGADLEDLAGEDPDRIRPLCADLARIQQAAERGAALTQQLLSFGNRGVSRPQVLRLDALVKQVRPMLSSTLGPDIALRVRTGALVWPVRVDPERMRQLLVNLAGNAREAMPQGGEVTVGVTNLLAVAASGDACRRFVRLRVSDQGLGMAPEVADRAFEPFFTTKPKGRGTGLGLATVYGTVAQAGGSVDLASRPGAGTTVTILLPVAETPVPPSEPADTGVAASAPPEDAGRQTVLLVDDEQGVRESTARVLGRYGYRVLTADSGGAALDLVHRYGRGIDLLLTDVIMPGMHGWELAERVRPLLPGVPVVFMSGYAEPMLDADEHLGEDMRLLEKPFTPAALIQALAEALAPAS